MPKLEGYLNTREAAEHLGVSPRRLRDLMSRKSLKSDKRLGSLYFFLIETLDAYKNHPENYKNQGYMGTREAAKYLNLRPYTLYYGMKQQLLNSDKFIGGRHLFLVETLDAYKNRPNGRRGRVAGSVMGPGKSRGNPQCPYCQGVTHKDGCSPIDGAQRYRCTACKHGHTYRDSETLDAYKNRRDGGKVAKIEGYLNVQEAAKYLSVKDVFLSNAMARQVLSSDKCVGRFHFFLVDTLDAYKNRIGKRRGRPVGFESEKTRMNQRCPYCQGVTQKHGCSPTDGAQRYRCKVCKRMHTYRGDTGQK